MLSRVPETYKPNMTKIKQYCASHMNPPAGVLVTKGKPEFTYKLKRKESLMQTEQRKKLELQSNQPIQLELLFDNPAQGQSQFGNYHLYSVRNGDATTEYSFFAPDEVHSVLNKEVQSSWLLS